MSTQYILNINSCGCGGSNMVIDNINLESFLLVADTFFKTAEPDFNMNWLENFIMYMENGCILENGRLDDYTRTECNVLSLVVRDVDHTKSVRGLLI